MGKGGGVGRALGRGVPSVRGLLVARMGADTGVPSAF